MNKKLSIAMGIALAGLSGIASAEPNSMGLEFSADVAMTTDYVWHGVTQTDEDPAIQGSFGVSHTSGLYANIWASNVDFGGDEHIEADYTIGWAGEVGPVTLDLGYVGIDYPGSENTPDLSNEFYIGVSGKVAMVDLGLKYTDDSDEYDWGYWDLSASVPVGQFSLAAHYGIHDNDDNAVEDWDDWSIGASTEFGGFGFDLTYHDTDISSANDPDGLADDRVVFTVSKSL